MAKLNVAAHAASHKTGGTDPLKAADIGTVPAALVPVMRTGTVAVPALLVNASTNLSVTWNINGVAVPFADNNYTPNNPVIVTSSGVVIPLAMNSFTLFPGTMSFKLTNISALTTAPGTISFMAQHL